MKGSNPINSFKSAVQGLYAYWWPFCMHVNDVPRTCKLTTATLKDLTQKAAHHLVVNLILSYRSCKGRESACVGNRRIREKQMEVLEMAEKESRNWFVFGKIRESEMCVSDCVQKINVSGQAFCSWCHETIRYGPVNQHFVWLFFCFKFTSYYFDICQFRRGNEDSRGNENSKSWKKYFPLEKISKSILFSLWKLRW